MRSITYTKPRPLALIARVPGHCLRLVRRLRIGLVHAQLQAMDRHERQVTDYVLGEMQAAQQQMERLPGWRAHHQARRAALQRRLARLQTHQP